MPKIRLYSWRQWPLIGLILNRLSAAQTEWLRRLRSSLATFSATAPGIACGYCADLFAVAAFKVFWRHGPRKFSPFYWRNSLISVEVVHRKGNLETLYVIERRSRLGFNGHFGGCATFYCAAKAADYLLATGIQPDCKVFEFLGRRQRLR
jgi:hypothetical protein